MAKTKTKTKKIATRVSDKIKLVPGGFYEARDGSIWCCFRVKPNAADHFKADCINVKTSTDCESFHITGEWIADKRESDSDLIKKVAPDRGILWGRQ